MENNNENLTNQNNGNQPVKKTYSAGLTVGILSIPCGLLIAISGWILGIVGIVINNKHKDEYNTTAGFTLSIIGLVLSILNSILGVYLSFK
jgi:hypothetical protein